jgi:hypothetical protein
MKLYHYTNLEGARGIHAQGIIYMSTDTINDCSLGVGVYLTSFAPEGRTKEEISQNNYGECS